MNIKQEIIPRSFIVPNVKWGNTDSSWYVFNASAMQLLTRAKKDATSKGRKIHEPNEISFAPESHLLLAKVLTVWLMYASARSINPSILLCFGFLASEIILPSWNGPRKVPGRSTGHMCHGRFLRRSPSTSSSLSAQGWWRPQCADRATHIILPPHSITPLEPAGYRSMTGPHQVHNHPRDPGHTGGQDVHWPVVHASPSKASQRIHPKKLQPLPKTAREKAADGAPGTFSWPKG